MLPKTIRRALTTSPSRSALIWAAAHCAMMAVAPAAAHAAPAEPSAADTRSASIEDIIVTARRTDENLSDVPVSLTALSATDLNQRAVASVFDLNKAVPGLTVQANNGSTALPAFAIRGRGQNYGAAAGSVEVYFAEVPLSPPFQEATLPVQFFDLASVQVLKGPQGTLFGRNTTGGAILIVPAAPTDRFEGYVRAQVGDYDNRQIEAAVNIPIVQDKIALRLAGFHWKRDGYMRTVGGLVNPLTGQVLPSQDYSNQNTTEFRATLSLRPVDGIENTTLLTYHYDKVRVSTSPGFSLGGPGTFIGNEPQSGLPVYQAPYFNTRLSDTRVDLNRPGNLAFALINTTSFELSDNLTLKNIFGYINAHSYTGSGQDADGTANLIYDLPVTPRRNINRQYTDEIQLQGTSFDNRFNWTIGALLDLTREPGGTRMNYQNYGISFGSYTTRFEYNRFTSYSFYAAGNFAITDQLNVSGGFRRTWDDIRQANELQPSNANPAIGLREFSNPANAVVTRGKFAGNTYNLGLDWHPTDDLMVYGGYRHGYKRGGFSSSGGNAFKPETIDSFSLGVKQEFEWGGVKGRYSIEGFYDFYRDMQNGYTDFDPNTFNFIGAVANIPKTEFKGIEADAAVDFTPWLQFNGAFSYIDAQNTSWPDTTRPVAGTQDLTVNPVPFVSKYKASATVRLHTQLSERGDEIAFAPTINYQSKFYTSPIAARLPLATQYAIGLIYGAPLIDFDQTAVGAATVPGYTTVDLRLEWNNIGGSKFSLAGNVTNLTDKYFLLYTQPNLQANVASRVPGAPRMFFIEGKFEF